MLNRGSSLAVCLGLLSSAGAFGQQYKIATLAGNGTSGGLTAFRVAKWDGSS